MPKKTFEKLKQIITSAFKSKRPITAEKITKTAKLFSQKKDSKKPLKNGRITPPPKLSNIPKIEDPFIKYERDAFRMKAFSLITGYSPAQKLQLLQNTPITRIVDPNSKEISLIQILTPFPGEQIELKGTFKRYFKRAEHTAPITGSFEAHTKSNIVGFPHPLQHTGWALNTSLIKKEELKKQLEEIQEKLKSNEKLRSNSIKWIEAKKQAFNENSKHFLKLQKKLIETASGNTHDAISRFFKWLENQENPYEIMSKVHANDSFTDSTITNYQSLIAKIKNPNLENCAKHQLENFIKTTSIPCLSKEETADHLEHLIKADCKILSLS